ncbi:MAG: tRNA pseudouridine(55) synthase TruB [Peptoniphilaceae bacterium]|nr:tRNA pseudouridine(55) synthase TruB [Peptoniphilaceae bacterium]
MTSGILNINKEKGISSQKCVYLVKKTLGIKKVGHTGTLDLEASGVLPVVIGKATRLSPYIMDEEKEYICEAIFGKRTDTLDFAGKFIDQSHKTFEKDELLKILDEFKGEIVQIPPMYSALKHKGKKLYELARDGIEIERKERKVNIYRLELIDFSFPKAIFRVKCSKGTYIRTLIDDIGLRMGTFAYVNNLTRSQVGVFRIEDSIKSQDLEKLGRDYLLRKMYPSDFPLTFLPSINLDKAYFKQAINGMTMVVDKFSLKNPVKVYCGGEFIGLGNSIKNGEKKLLKMEKVFYDK